MVPEAIFWGIRGSKMVHGADLWPSEVSQTITRAIETKNGVAKNLTVIPTWKLLAKHFGQFKGDWRLDIKLIEDKGSRLVHFLVIDRCQLTEACMNISNFTTVFVASTSSGLVLLHSMVSRLQINDLFLVTPRQLPIDQDIRQWHKAW